jgi:hypothetical protein
MLQPGREDKHIFSIAPDGRYSAKSAYKGLSWAQVCLGITKGCGNLGTLQNVAFSFGWLPKTGAGQLID